jgi:hypothetical protein
VAPRWLAVGAMIALVILAWGVWWFAHRQFIATWALSASGAMVDWDLSEGQWKRGGVSTVTFRTSGWRVRDVEDSDLDSLTHLSHLESLSLSQCFRITDHGLRILRRLPELKSLDLGMSPAYPQDSRGSQFTDAAIPNLMGLSRLEELTLSGANLTDASVPRLAALKNLKFLDLTDTKVTDASLPYFERDFPKLDTLVLDKTQVSPEAARRLAAARPNVQVVHPSMMPDGPPMTSTPE